MALAAGTRRLPEILVTDGCIYVANNDQRARCIRTVRLKVTNTYVNVPGSVRKPSGTGGDPGRSGILRYPSTSFASYPSSTGEILLRVTDPGAAGLYYNATAADFMKEGAPRESFKEMIREIRR